MGSGSAGLLAMALQEVTAFGEKPRIGDTPGPAEDYSLHVWAPDAVFACILGDTCDERQRGILLSPLHTLSRAAGSMDSR